MAEKILAVGDTALVHVPKSLAQTVELLVHIWRAEKKPQVQKLMPRITAAIERIAAGHALEAVAGETAREAVENILPLDDKF